jgi:hypothetical protein
MNIVTTVFIQQIKQAVAMEEEKYADQERSSEQV